ncbi:hypothetical protein DY218_14160 [Streptomyces triticagri]|uniref:Uncharacterized protein n=2 Tax=Streptomyces triticagri TaxID=2293568 RepID=A0A372M6W4_9ACTN|nr:hypothetical protein DY218_14160 [Streptomyces triticagri]
MLLAAAAMMGAAGTLAFLGGDRVVSALFAAGTAAYAVPALLAEHHLIGRERVPRSDGAVRRWGCSAVAGLALAAFAALSLARGGDARMPLVVGALAASACASTLFSLQNQRTFASGGT